MKDGTRSKRRHTERRPTWQMRLLRFRDWIRQTNYGRSTRWGIVVLLLIGLGAFGTGAAVAAWANACTGGCPTAEMISDFAPQQASEVYDSEGGLLGMFYHERRQLISLDGLPPHVPLAFVAVEDRRFFDHEGVDWQRVPGAVMANVRARGAAEGFSTITMQLARNLFPQQLPRNEKTIRRKLGEIKLAMAMERRFSKKRILELYLNHIYLGAGAYGVEAAAQTYFGKPAAELTPSEAATLAGLPQAPSFYNPRRNAEAAERRRNRVLTDMAALDVITPEQSQAAQRDPLRLAPPKGALRASYFVEQVRRELEDEFGELLYTGGLKIHTTLDPELQQVAEEALEDHLRQIEKGTYGYFPHQSYETFVEEKGRDRVDRTPYLQGVVAVLDPFTGDVRALVGGRDFEHSQFNRATQALRQPGSAFKPFVYAAALEQGRSPLYSVSDAPIFLSQSDGSTWTPRNYSGEYGGMMSLREALRRSKNMVAIRLGREIGIENVRSVVERTGIDTQVPGYPSVYIGAADVYPLELIAAYAAFANGGMHVEPHLVSRIQDHEGRLLWQPPHHPDLALDPAVAWLMTDMMREVVDRGTAYNVRNPQVGNFPYDIPAAGKTGTTNDATDVWFVGYTPELLAGVWLGFDQPARITKGATGGGARGTRLGAGYA